MSTSLLLHRTGCLRLQAMTLGQAWHWSFLQMDHSHTGGYCSHHHSSLQKLQSDACWRKSSMSHGASTSWTKGGYHWIRHTITRTMVRAGGMINPGLDACLSSGEAENQLEDSRLFDPACVLVKASSGMLSPGTIMASAHLFLVPPTARFDSGHT